MDVSEVIKDAYNYAKINPDFILSIKDEDLLGFYEKLRLKNAALGDTLESLSEEIDRPVNGILEKLKQEMIDISTQVNSEAN